MHKLGRLSLGLAFTLCVGCSPAGSDGGSDPPASADDAGASNTQRKDGGGKAGASGGSGGGSGGNAGSTSAGGQGGDAKLDAGASPVDAAPPSDGGTSAVSDGAAPADAKGPSATEVVFSTNKLHEIAITLEPASYAAIFTDKVECDPVKKDQRYLADVTFDGIKLTRVGARRKGNWGSISATRPAFSLKFDWDPARNDQRLAGLDRLTLNNAIQDIGFVAEHLTYEVARRSGIAAPLTSHALVTVNGVPRGIYVIKESIDADFLKRSFGDGNHDGNTYEGEWLREECGGVKPEFLLANESAGVATAVVLKDEVKEKRSRADLTALIDAVRKTSTTAQAGDQWIAAVDMRVDLGRFYTFMAVEALTNHHDGYVVLANNYFLYNRPDTKKFDFIHHGADRAFEATEPVDAFAPHTSEAPNLARFVLQIAKTNQKYKDEVNRILRSAWDVNALLARVAAVNTAFMPLRSRSEAVIKDDLRRFDGHRPVVEKIIRDRKALAK